VQQEIGTVVWFSAKKGFGFIKSEDPMDEKDIFVHWSGISMEGYKQLTPGDKVSYVLAQTDKGIVAVEVKLI
jgi:CspA family cold shock protein